MNKYVYDPDFNREPLGNIEDELYVPFTVMISVIVNIMILLRMPSRDVVAVHTFGLAVSLLFLACALVRMVQRRFVCTVRQA
jgi:hypothetical protein